MSNKHIETLLVHQNFRGDEVNSVARGIYPTTAYYFNDADHGADLFDLKVAGNIYTRLTNTTNDQFGQVVSDLEGGVGGLSFASGAAAITATIQTICSEGDHIVASSSLYGGTLSLFANTLKRQGITTTLIDQDTSYEELSLAFTPNTKVLFAETIGNPTVPVLDLEKFSKLAKEHKVPLIIDATFTPPTLFKSKDYGADIIIHSTSKYISGHGNALGGVVVDCGTFDWHDNKYKDFHTKDPAYHDLVFTDVFGSAAFIYRLRTIVLRDTGGTPSPFNSYLSMVGLQTLHLRTDYVSKNALKLAKWLEENQKVEWVSYPLLPSHKDYALAEKYFTNGGGGILSFGIKGDLEASKRFVNALQLGVQAVNVGDVRTIVSHPASTTHRQVPEADLAKSGITASLIRVSVGLEHIDDIIDDIRGALEEV